MFWNIKRIDLPQLRQCITFVSEIFFQAANTYLESVILMHTLCGWIPPAACKMSRLSNIYDCLFGNNEQKIPGSITFSQLSDCQQCRYLSISQLKVLQGRNENPTVELAFYEAHLPTALSHLLKLIFTYACLFSNRLEI